MVLIISNSHFFIRRTCFIVLMICFNLLVSQLANAQCTAAIGYTAKSLTGCDPFSVKFLDKSGGNIASRLWDFGDGATSSAKNPAAHNFNPGKNDTTYIVRLSIDCGGGVNDTTYATVSVKTCSGKLEGPVPQVITPNNDGYNDRWIIPGIEFYEKNSISIYNQWGSLVYTRGSYQNTWEGTNVNDIALVDGIYFYVIDLGNETEPYTGYVVIQR